MSESEHSEGAKESAPQKGNGRESGACEVEARKDEEVDAVGSSTRTDEVYTRNPLAPFGLRAAWVICFVGLARQYYGIACAMPPCI